MTVLYCRNNLTTGELTVFNCRHLCLYMHYITQVQRQKQECWKVVETQQQVQEFPSDISLFCTVYKVYTDDRALTTRECSRSALLATSIIGNSSLSFTRRIWLQNLYASLKLQQDKKKKILITASLSLFRQSRATYDKDTVQSFFC